MEHTYFQTYVLTREKVSCLSVPLFHFTHEHPQTPSIYWAFAPEQTLEQTLNSVPPCCICGFTQENVPINLYTNYVFVFCPINQEDTFFVFRSVRRSNPHLAWTTYFPRGLVCLYRFVTIGSHNSCNTNQKLQFGYSFLTLFLVCIID